MASPIPVKEAEASLQRKGFVQVNNNHRMFYLYHDDKDTGIRTMTSHSGGEIHDNLVSSMKRQLKLDTNRQTRDLLCCPMGKDAYIQFLKHKDII